MTAVSHAGAAGARNGLAALDAATTRMPAWIVRGMVIRLLGALSLLLLTPLALPWTTMLTIPLRVTAGAPRAIGIVPDIARGAIGAETPVELSLPGRPVAIGRIVAFSDGAAGADRIVVALPDSITTQQGTAATARIVVRRGRLADAIFGNIVASVRR